MTPIHIVILLKRKSGGKMKSFLFSALLAFSLSTLSVSAHGALWHETGSVTIGGSESIVSFALSPKADSIATVTNKMMSVYSLPSGSLSFTTQFSTTGQGWAELDYSPDGKKLSMVWKASGTNLESDRMELWNLETKTRIFWKDVSINDEIVLSEDASRIAISSWDEGLQIINGNNGQVITTITNSTFFRGGPRQANRLAGYNDDTNETHIYDFQTGNLLATFPGYFWRFSADGSFVVVTNNFGGADTISVWNLAQNQLMSTWTNENARSSYVLDVLGSSVIYEYANNVSGGKFERRNSTDGSIIWSHPNQHNWEVRDLQVTPDQSEILVLESIHSDSSGGWKYALSAVNAVDGSVTQTIIPETSASTLYYHVVIDNNRFVVETTTADGRPVLKFFEKF